MPDIARAQSLLSLFTSADCAEAMAGDLAEERRDHGSTWFWLHVFGTTVTLWWSAVGGAPVTILALTIAGLASLAAPALAGIAAVSLFPQLIGSLVSWIVLSLFWWGGALCSGFALVGFAPARGMTACVMLAVIGEALLIAFGLAGIAFHMLRTPFDVLYATAVLAAAPLVAGGAIARSRMIAAGRPALEPPR